MDAKLDTPQNNVQPVQRTTPYPLAQQKQSWGNFRSPPVFKRPELATLLNCTPLTIANKEKQGILPIPARQGNVRLYTLQDVIQIMHIMNGEIDLMLLAAVLYDKGYSHSSDVIAIKQELDFYFSSLNKSV